MIGTSARSQADIERIRSRFESFAEDPLYRYGKLLLLNLDFTVVKPIDPDSLATRAGNMQLMPNILTMIRAYKNMGFLIGMYSSQGGIAHGFRTLKDVSEQIDELTNIMGEDCFDVAYICPFHQGGTIPRFAFRSLTRKPGYGSMAVLEYYVYDQLKIIIDWNESIVVGHSSRERSMARKAGVPFRFTEHFLGIQKESK